MSIIIKLVGSMTYRKWMVVTAYSCSVFVSSGVQASGIEYHDIVGTSNTGISYQNKPGIYAESPLINGFKQGELFFTNPHLALIPNSKGASGSPGIAAFDYDRDGDVDLYVTNSNQLQANSLLVNQLKQTGQATFVERGVASGVGLLADAEHLESTGTCFGDIDNDGDDDLYVTGLGTNVLFENLGDGNFRNVTTDSGTGGEGLSATACSFGDVNNDGLLDLVVANSYNGWQHRLPINVFGFDHLIEPNQLFINIGDNKFEENAAAAGIRTSSGVTWALALVDIDQDGDVDLISGDDQGPKPGQLEGGVDQGVIRTYLNDGTGNFTDFTETSGIVDPDGAWMGLAIGDLNGDSHLDIFATDSGTHQGVLAGATGGFPTPLRSSRWFFGSGDGTYYYPGIGALGTSPFGWGSVIVDYDNDGDNDIVFHGGVDSGVFVDATNPGAILNNDGSGNFTRDSQALLNSTNHSRRNVQSLVNADINNDGFIDFVTASNIDWPEAFPLITYAAAGITLPGQFSDSDFAWPTYRQVSSDTNDGFIWNGLEPIDGSLAIEVSSGNNNKSFRISARGSVGDLNGGKVNRSGIGAVMKVTLDNGQVNVRPVVSGATHNSASELALDFGMGDSRKAVVEVLWPNGVRNRLYKVRSGDRIVIPEIPCGYDDDSLTNRGYVRCVWGSLSKLRRKKVIDRKMYVRLFYSALKARYYQ